MTSKLQGPTNMLRKSVLALCAALSLVSCDEPEQDKFKSQGGISPDPTGIIDGSVLYVGPRPQCKYEGGKATKVIGRVVLTMFHYDNPAPPEGRATTALNLKFVNPEDLFTLADCLPEDEVADPTDIDGRITRSADFTWPQIVLGAAGANVEYQIRAFYDTDEDMNPFFSVRNLPTEGDIAGGALANVQVPAEGLLRIVMPPASKAKNGYRRQGVIVALGNYVWLERPAFKLNERRYLDATKTVVPRQKAMTDGEIDVEASVLEGHLNFCALGSGATPGCGLKLQQLSDSEIGESFARGGVVLDFDPSKYAFVSEPVDVLTIQQGRDDVLKPDGVPDPHPLLGSNLGVPWYTPIVIATRLAPTASMQAIEAQAGIPNVRMIGSVLLKNSATPGEEPKPAKRVTLDEIDVSIPPIAAVELDPVNTSCRVPYVPPGAITRAYESRLTYCEDLPTGIYSVSALQGVIGGTRSEAGPDESDNGFVYDGAPTADLAKPPPRLSGQAWTVPNDLGNPAQIRPESIAVSQSPLGALLVFDRNSSSKGDCSKGQDTDMNLLVRPIRYNGMCEGKSSRTENDVGKVGAGIDGNICLPEACCAAIEHLCGVQLCEQCTEETCPGLEFDEDRPILQGPTRIESVTKEGKSVPNCLPFPMPELCCPPE